MTQSLTERLAERLATQSAEIEALTTSALARLGLSLTRESEAALRSMRSAIQESIEATRQPMMRDLERLRRIGRWWWSALLLSWATIALLLGFWVWRWMNAEPTGLAMYQTFTYEGRTFLMLPEGTQALTCRQGTRQGMPCVVLPGPETRLGEETGAATTGTDEGPGTTPGQGPILRPAMRPSER